MKYLDSYSIETGSDCTVDNTEPIQSLFNILNVQLVKYSWNLTASNQGQQRETDILGS